MINFKTLILLGLLCVSSAVHSKDSATFMVGEWGPFTSSDDRLANLAVALVKRALRYSHIRTHVEYHDWDQSYQALLDGDTVASFPWQKTQTRASDVIFPREPLIKAESVFFYRHDSNFHWETPSDLSQYRLGGIDGYAHVDFYKQHDLSYLPAKNQTENIQNLLDGKIDAFIANKYVGYYFLKKAFSADNGRKVGLHKTVVYDTNLYVAFSKKHPDTVQLMEQLDAGLQHIKNTGKYDEVIGFYLANQ